MTATQISPAQLDALPIHVLEIHIDDQPVCAGCGWPAALDGHCVCGDFQPEPHLLAVVYTDVRATRAANAQA
jgi:hypothetical protein